MRVRQYPCVLLFVGHQGDQTFRKRFMLVGYLRQPVVAGEFTWFLGAPIVWFLVVAPKLVAGDLSPPCARVLGGSAFLGCSWWCDGLCPWFNVSSVHGVFSLDG